MQQKIYYWINNPRACHGGVSLPENEQISCGTSFSLYALVNKGTFDQQGDGVVYVSQIHRPSPVCLVNTSIDTSALRPARMHLQVALASEAELNTRAGTSGLRVSRTEVCIAGTNKQTNKCNRSVQIANMLVCLLGG